ncbi:MAG: glycosyltransferase [Deltaproteobacteria bacterium]|nr:glycosyltransferase [Deltaproteobacteria bacterium]MBW2595406.1 glycosyltransferase [Deltaproteobacteria bacterium]
MEKFKVACIGNYPPRECGIATFTRDLIDSVERTNEAEGHIIAMNDRGQSYSYPEKVRYVIRQDYQQDYLKAVKFINHSDADICVLEHEFGIFGGDSGIYILPLIHRLEIPFIATLHTVLKKPSYNERAIIHEIGEEAEKVVVMSRLAIDFLTETYDVPRDKIELFEHGVPDFDPVQRNHYKKKIKLEKKKSLLTFGLLSRSKGIETVIQALPEVVRKHPDLIYIVLGKTHPAVVRVSGEEYRNYLRRLVEKNNLRKHVYFYDSFVSSTELFEYLSATDIYITPYLNKAQITSGTLAYAVGAGAAVISTPYWHAQELLADGRGRLFDFHDSNALAGILNELLDDPSALLELRQKAYDYGRRMTWPIIGRKYTRLIRDVVQSYPVINVKEESVVDPLVLPPFNLAHVRRLTDDTGIIQHARYSVPNRKEGYCLDDNARGLLMATMAYRQQKDPATLELLPVYLSYTDYMQNEDGSFRNFLSYNRNFLDEVGSEDSFGRTIWALGYLIHFSPNDAFFQLANELFSRAYPNLQNMHSIRGIANTIIGICHYLHRYPSDEGMNKTLRDMAYKIVVSYENESDQDWRWFEPALTYDNGIIPLALFHAHEITGDEKALAVARETADFLEKIIFRDEYLAPVGTEGWYQKGGQCAQYAQQAIDVMASVMMFYQAYVVTMDKHYLDRMFASFMWFLGENDLRIPLYDFETCGCCDGLESHGVNRNQGAESILAYLIAHLTVLRAHEHET